MKTLIKILFSIMVGTSMASALSAQSVYDFTVKDMKGNDVSLSQYKGKVLLIVNTATECGFTPQYEALQAMYDKFKDKGDSSVLHAEIQDHIPAVRQN